MKYPQSSLLLGNNSTQVRRDIKHRILFNIFEQERQLLKQERANMNNKLVDRLNIQQKLNSLPSSQIKIKNRCVLTGRSRSTYRYFKLSRIMIKDLAAYGLLPGIIKV